MPLFITDSELGAAGSDVSLVAERADAYILDLSQKLEAMKARADASAITSEQRCSVVEQKFLAISAQFREMENTKTQLENTLQSRSAELSQAQAQVHKLELELMKRDTDKERSSCELNEMRKARRELLELVEQKNTELNEKNTYIKMYLDKIVFLTDERSILEGKLHEAEAEMARSQSVQARLSQEKDLLEQHNTWLNQELTEKVSTLLREKRSSSDMEMEMRSKLTMVEQTCKQTEESLQRNKEQVKDLELRLNQTREELKFTKENAENKENHLSLELETASKLVELYKQSSEEWSNKAIDLEGVIKALEAHLNDVEAELKNHLAKEVEMRKSAEKDAMEAKEKIEKLEKEIESLKKAKDEESSFSLFSSLPDTASKGHNISDRQLSLELEELHNDASVLPIVPAGISGTALAATLLRDGWSITKIYVKYQEAVDAWRHERQERRHSEALLQRVLQEIERRAEQILDERAEHSRMAEAYALIEERLHLSVEEQYSLENQIMELKAEVRKRERDLNALKQECSDLQYQVTTLLKECADVKHHSFGDNGSLKADFEDQQMIPTTASDALISQRLVTFKDIHEMVQQNSQLRAIARSLSQQNEEHEKELKEAFDLQLKRRTDEAAQKVSTILRKSEEQIQLISSLQGTVGMYKRLYEEELKSRSGGTLPKENKIIATIESDGNDVRNLVIKSEEEIEKVRKEASDRLSVLEEELGKCRQDANLARMERDRLVVESNYAREQLQRIINDSENQRKEMDAVLARNVEFSQIITDYQRRLRENGEYVQSVEENCRRLSVEVNVLEREKELISNAEKRASQELSSLSDRVHRLQATLDNIHTVEEAHGTMRAAEKKKLEDEVNRMQKEWVEMKHELDSERAHVRHLMNERDMSVNQTMDRIESLAKELTDALNKASMFEARSLIAENRCIELEANLKRTEEKVNIMSARKETGKDVKEGELETDTEVLTLLEQTREEIEHLKEELDASKSHTDQYKKLAQANEEALLRVEDAHNRYKEEAEKMKESLEAELSSYRNKVIDLEKLLMTKENELLEAETNRETALSTSQKDLALLRESDSGKRILLEQAEERIKTLKNELEKQHQLWRAAQTNYERQVLLQADTIRELTVTSQHNEKLEKEVADLRSKLTISMSELESSSVSWEMEKESLLSEKESLTTKLREVEEQNRILLDRTEATHTRSAEYETTGDTLKSIDHTENDLHDIIRYLRRSKETSDMEISLLKQERTRFQKQLEAALHAADDAQATLRRERESARVALCSDEEFKSLQAQVREMRLLRESNEQLRMENKRNFEECQSLREKLQKEQSEVETLRKLLREREVELEATFKDVDLQKAEVARWENRVSQLHQKYKSFDLDDYNRIQLELTSSQETLRLHQSELEAAKRELEKQDASRRELEKLQEGMRRSEQEISSKDEKIAGLEKQLKDVEASTKTETDKLKRQFFIQKRKIETIMKEKDDAIKQLEEMKANSTKRGTGESHRTEAQVRQEVAAQVRQEVVIQVRQELANLHDQALKENENLLKEKETRIQTLERTLEREREDLKKEKDEHKKEKQRRLRDQKTYYDFAQKQDQEKKILLEELSTLKRENETSEEKQRLLEEVKREKEISEEKQKLEELNAIRREKENSENVQAKKTGRRIVRPKIESPVEPQILPEASESGVDIITELPEVEAEMRDDSKLESSVVAEIAEVVSTSSAIIVAPTISLMEDLTGARKRSSSQAQGPAEDAIFANKKQKGVDLRSVAESEVVQSVTETLIVSEPRIGEMDVEHTTMVVTVVENNDSNTISPEIPQIIDSIENNQEAQPTLRNELTALKRPRIVRPGTFSPHSAMAQRDDVLVGTDEEKGAAAVAEPSSEIVVARETSEFLPTDAHLHTLTQPSPERNENMEAIDIVDNITVQASSQDKLFAPEIEGSESLIIDLNDTTDSLVDPRGTPPRSELEVIEKTSEQGIPEGPSNDSGVDIEDGEIDPDEKEDHLMEISHQVSGDIADESNTLTLDAVDKDAQQHEETQPEDKTATTRSDPQEKNPNASESSENVNVAVPLRQVRRGVTVSLPERQIGRRLGGTLPPSPGAARRNTRSTKRGLGVRGRGSPSSANPEARGDQEAKQGDIQSGNGSQPPSAEDQ